jgi:hypothetical protein
MMPGGMELSSPAEKAHGHPGSVPAVIAQQAALIAAIGLSGDD